MAIIRYIGKKPRKEDNVAGTGIVWECPGDEQQVHDPVAVEKMLAHPGIWELVTPLATGTVNADKKPAAKGKAKTKGKAQATKRTKPTSSRPKDKPEDEERDLPPVVNFNRLGKDKIEAYARQHLGYEVDQRKSLQDIRAEAAAHYARISKG